MTDVVQKSKNLLHKNL